MKTFYLILLTSIFFSSCKKGEKEEQDPFPRAPSSIVGEWESKYSYLTVRDDFTFKFSVKVEGSKSRGSGVWEPSKDGGFYFRYRAETSNDYMSSQAEYFRIEDDGILFLHIDEGERFTKISK